MRNIIFIALIALLFQGCSIFRIEFEEERYNRMQKLENYKNDEFENEIETEQLKTNMFSLMWKFMFNKPEGSSPEIAPEIQELTTEAIESIPDTGLHVSWFGHSTVLLKIEGKLILIDPQFSTRASVFQWIGPHRFHEVPIKIEDLPPIDVVVISHDHYDHLDEQSIIELNEKTDVFLMPLGVGQYPENWGIPKEKIYEFAWWDDITIDNIRFVCTPARHFSGRGMFSRNRTLWASWTILGEEYKVYYSGDGGPQPAFSTIGEKYGPFDLSIMQLGAYGEYWPYIHLTPEEAIEAHQQVKAKVMIPVHWGTFDLALHPWKEPIERTRIAASDEQIEFLDVKPGEIRNLSYLKNTILVEKNIPLSLEKE